MAYERRETERRPTHPGFVIRMELDELGMSVQEAADRLGVARPTLSKLVNENKSVSPEMALRLGRFFGNGTDVWLNMQTRHDRWEVEHDPEALKEAQRVKPARAIA